MNAVLSQEDIARALATILESSSRVNEAKSQKYWFPLSMAGYGTEEIPEDQGVETRPIVVGNIVRQPAGSLFPELSGLHLPGADRVHARGFYVGLHPFVSETALDRLLGCFETFAGRYSAACASA